MSVVSIQELNASLKNVCEKISPNFTSSIMEDLKKYSEVEATQEIVKYYFEAFENIAKQINTMNVDKSVTSEIIKVFSIIISMMGQNECINSVLILTNEEKEKYKKMASDLIDQLSETTNKYNDLAKKYNEKELKFTLPNIALSVIRKDKGLNLNTDQILEIYKKLGDKKIDDKYRRLSVKNLAPKAKNISRIYAKENEVPQVIQK